MNSFVHTLLFTYHLFPWIKYLEIEILGKKKALIDFVPQKMCTSLHIHEQYVVF